MLSALPLIASLLFADLPPAAKPYFVMSHLKGAKWDQCHENNAWEERSRKHRAYIFSQMEAGKIVVAGALTDEGRLLSLGVINVPTLDEAKAILDADDQVKNGCLTYEIHPAILIVRTPPQESPASSAAAVARRDHFARRSESREK